MYRKIWKEWTSFVWTITFENAGDSYVAFGGNKTGIPIYRRDRSRRGLIPIGLTYPRCFELMPMAVMTSRLRRRRLRSILDEYGAVTDKPGPAVAGYGRDEET